MPYAACLYHFWWRKKKGKYYIIPASYFLKKGIVSIKVDLSDTQSNQKDKITKPAHIDTHGGITETPVKIAQKIAIEKPKIILNSQSKTTSGLSLSSIKKKKEHLIKQMDVILEEDDLPKDPFTEEQMQKFWVEYVKKIETQGKHNLVSILSIDTPKLRGTAIHLEFPNATNKIEVERQQYELLGYLRQNLNNFDINLVITVNEEMSKKYAYTDMEKFEKLKEKNSNIDLLRKTFDLEI